MGDFDYGYLKNLIAEVAADGLNRTLQKDLTREYSKYFKVVRITVTGNQLGITLDTPIGPRLFQLVVNS